MVAAMNGGDGTFDPGARPELTWLPVAHLEVDPTYQRLINSATGRKHVEKIAANFCWAAFQAILATPKRGSAACWLIIDGQHRVEAAKIRDIPLVPAVVIHDADRAAQSMAFVAANRDRLSVPIQAIFHARAAAGQTEAVTILRLCDAANITILRANVQQRKLAPGHTTGVTALLWLLNRFGEEKASQAIKAVAESFGDQEGGLRAPIFMAAGLFLAGGGSPEELRAALGKVGLSKLIDIDIAGGPYAMAPVMAARLRSTPIAAPPHKVGPLSPAKPIFEDDPRARRDRGSMRSPGLGAGLA